MEDHSKSGLGGPPKRPIDEIIENMTANLHDSDGQYMQLGFTPPPTPANPLNHHWGAATHHGYLPPGHPPNNVPMYLQEHMGPPPNDPPPFLNTRSHSQSSLGGLIGREVQPDPNYFMFGNSHPYMGPFVINDQNNSGMSSSYSQYRNENDYGFFMSPPPPNPPPPQPQSQPPPQERNNALIEHLVGNWSTPGGGSYSPFGSGTTNDRIIEPPPQMPVQQQQQPLPPQPPPPQQQAPPPQPQHVVIPPQEEKIIPKKRIVAEVRPMRPSYSDILSKSPPTKTRTLSPNIAKMELNTIKPIKVPAKGGKVVGSKKTTSNLKRQHSGEENIVQKSSMDSVRSPSPAPLVFRRRVSLDDFDGSVQGEEDEERPDSSQDSSSQSGDNSGGKSVDMLEKSRSARNGSEPRGEGSGGGGSAGGGSLPLNNHKSSRLGGGSKQRALHINNNLVPPQRTSEKNIIKGGRPCKTCGEERRGGSQTPSVTTKSESKAGPSATASVTSPSSSSRARSSSQSREKASSHGGGGARKGKNKKKACPYSFSAVWPIVHRHMMQWAAVVVQAVAWFLHLLSDVLGLSSRLSWHMCGAIYMKIKTWGGDAWRYLRGALPMTPSPHSQQQHQHQHRKSRHRGAPPPPPPRPRWWSRWIPSWVPWLGSKKPWEPGEAANTKLEANLPLPATGEEAMKRLLACRGKDPYSILGVAPTCTDDDIKRYYKRQAFLVHPDKNSQPGAEEAFKILVHAFDIIGEPEKRQVYDATMTRSHQTEAAWSELSDLLAQLHQKMEEAATTIRCTNCGKRHRRVLVDRPSYAARACAQCKIRHAAREGDIWAESSWLGFLWHYYACMEGSVYDITEWAACQADNLRHLRANSHAVQYRIVLGKKHQNNNPRPPPPDTRRPPEQPSEPDFEDFLNSLYGQSGCGGPGGGRKDNDSPQRHADNSRKRKGKRKK